MAAIAGTSDLQPGVYEGGYKLWECAIDLANVLVAASQGDALGSAFRLPDLCGARVLELGCGLGVPGVCALLLGAAHVTFQDFNAGVLQRATAPTVAANVDAPSRVGADGAVAYVAGPWGGLPALLLPGSVDVVLSSETIYAVGSYPALLAAVEHVLAPGGVAVFAAKSYYFGVGGGVLAFADAARRRGFAVHSLREFRDGVSNVREVFALVRTHAATGHA